MSDPETSSLDTDQSIQNSTDDRTSDAIWPYSHRTRYDGNGAYLVRGDQRNNNKAGSQDV